MFFVEARQPPKPGADKVPPQIRYTSHREEGLQGGERRELFGIGDRYKVLRGDEKAIERAFRRRHTRVAKTGPRAIRMAAGEPTMSCLALTVAVVTVSARDIDALGAAALPAGSAGAAPD